MDERERLWSKLALNISVLDCASSLKLMCLSKGRVRDKKGGAGQEEGVIPSLV